MIGAWRIDNGLELSRSIGDMPYHDRGVISTPDITQYALKSGVGSIVLVSDGILDKMSETEICALVEETKLNCSQSFRSQPLDPPIPLSGETMLTKASTSCEPLRLGLSPETELLGHESSLGVG